MAETKIVVAIIGSGNFVREKHLPAILASPLLSLKAIYSRSLTSAQSLLELGQLSAVDLYADDAGSGRAYHDLLRRPDIQAVVIALPIGVQPDFVTAALTAGKHVLSEKPIAPTLEAAFQLVRHYESLKNQATWAIAENYRFLNKVRYAADEVSKLGKISGFSVQMLRHIEPGSKYFETSWRKEPSHQGGYLLDGGVHSIAALRLLLGNDRIETLSAYTASLKQYLPPVDTVTAILRTKSGIPGVCTLSFGSLLSGNTMQIAAEHGSVTVGWDSVNVVYGDANYNQTDTKTFDDPGYGVPAELEAWADALISGQPHLLQSPEQALADLEILEMMLKSGEAKGQGKVLKLQDVCSLAPSTA